LKKFALSELDAAMVDLDGTMVDTLGDFAQAVNRMLAQLDLPAMVPAAIESMVGKDSEHLIRSVLAHVGAPAQRYPDAWANYQSHYAVVNGMFSSVFPGVSQGLRALVGRGLKLACLTNKPTAFARDLLAHKGLAGYFQLVFGGDAFERKNPIHCHCAKPARRWACDLLAH
jgi:phosphoglycolate phosphatase